MIIKKLMKRLNNKETYQNDQFLIEKNKFYNNRISRTKNKKFIVNPKK